ncbi:addiction module protein [Flavobacterium sp. RHBU_24]|uniref:addiction module protein n=1 Tax=Flavobacterium sp. RHBU_24 TaxID=3391185 RepID=UPI0039855202
MNLQYILDGKGETTGVFIPIQEWLSFKKKFKNIDIDDSDIPEWHKEELDHRLEAIKNGDEQFHDYNEAMNDILKELED